MAITSCFLTRGCHPLESHYDLKYFENKFPQKCKEQENFLFDFLFVCCLFSFSAPPSPGRKIPADTKYSSISKKKWEKFKFSKIQKLFLGKD